jgi:hypothetical protein
MLQLINEIELNETIDQNHFFSLFQVQTFEKNLEILEEIQKYFNFEDFLTKFSHQNISNFKNFISKNNLIDIFIKNINIDDFSKFKGCEKFMTIMSNIIILLKIYYKLNSLLEKTQNKLKNIFSLKFIDEQNINEKLDEISNEFFSLDHIKEKSFSRISTKPNTKKFQEEDFKILTPKFEQSLTNISFKNKDDFNIFSDINEINQNNNNKHLSVPNNNNNLFNNNLDSNKKRQTSILTFSSLRFDSLSDNDLNDILKDTPKNYKSSNDIIEIEKNPIKKLLIITSEMFKKNLLTLEERDKLKGLIIEKNKDLLMIFYKNILKKETLYNKIKYFIK